MTSAATSALSKSPWAMAATAVGVVTVVGGTLLLLTHDAHAAEPALPIDPTRPVGPPNNPDPRQPTPNRPPPSADPDLPAPPFDGPSPGPSEPQSPRQPSAPRRPKAPPKPQPAENPPRNNAKGKAGSSGAERRNAALTVVAQPTTHAPRSMAMRDDQPLGDWLANVAYWDTYPDAPTKLDPNDATHKTYIKAWVRIRGYVDRGLAILPELGPHPVAPGSPPAAHDDWHRWALAVAFSSSLRSPDELRTAFKKAWHYVFLDANGMQWVARHLHSTVAGLSVAIDGLLAEAGVYMSTNTFPEAHRILEQWPDTLTKSFAAANRVMVRS